MSAMADTSPTTKAKPVSEVRPETCHLFRTGGVQGESSREIEYTKFYIGEFPFPNHQGPIDDKTEALLDEHFHLLDVTYDDHKELNAERKFLAALRTLANAFGTSAQGTYHDEDYHNSYTVTVDPKDPF